MGASRRLPKQDIVADILKYSNFPAGASKLIYALGGRVSVLGTRLLQMISHFVRMDTHVRLTRYKHHNTSYLFFPIVL